MVYLCSLADQFCEDFNTFRENISGIEGAILSPVEVQTLDFKLKVSGERASVQRSYDCNYLQLFPLSRATRSLISFPEGQLESCTR